MLTLLYSLIGSLIILLVLGTLICPTLVNSFHSLTSLLQSAKHKTIVKSLQGSLYVLSSKVCVHVVIYGVILKDGSDSVEDYHIAKLFSLSVEIL